MLTYTISRIGAPKPAGITHPRDGSIQAVFKYDSRESRRCVYNETVANRLAQYLGIPVVLGVPVTHAQGLMFASLVFSRVGMSLPPILEKHGAAVCAAYPNESAALLAFDCWIGNADRAENMRARLGKSGFQFFAAFDHSHCLLEIEDGDKESLERLNSDDSLVKHHFLLGGVDKHRVLTWASMIAALSPSLIGQACRGGTGSFSGVDEYLQDELAEALAGRANRLPELLTGVLP